jgi:hypothetical protein
MEIITLLASDSPTIDYTTIRQLSNIAEAMLAMTGRITMLGIYRWTEKYGSYRTIQRSNILSSIGENSDGYSPVVTLLTQQM